MPIDEGFVASVALKASQVGAKKEMEKWLNVINRPDLNTYTGKIGLGNAVLLHAYYSKYVHEPRLLEEARSLLTEAIRFDFDSKYLKNDMREELDKIEMLMGIRKPNGLLKMADVSTYKTRGVHGNKVGKK